MKTITLVALWDEIEQRKAAIGWCDDQASTDALRNTGLRRTQRKRDLLARAEARAIAAGRPVVPSKY